MISFFWSYSSIVVILFHLWWGQRKATNVRTAFVQLMPTTSATARKLTSLTLCTRASLCNHQRASPILFLSPSPSLSSVHMYLYAVGLGIPSMALLCSKKPGRGTILRKQGLRGSQPSGVFKGSAQLPTAQSVSDAINNPESNLSYLG